jgi:hypothetical protein
MGALGLGGGTYLEAGSCHGADKFLPEALGLEDQVADLPDGAPAPGQGGDPVGRSSDFRDRIRHRHPQAHPAKQGQVHQFVAHRRHLGRGEVQCRQEFLQNGRLVPDAFIEAADPQFPGPVERGVGTAPRHHSHLDAAPLGHLDAVAVPDVKNLNGFPFGVEIKPAVGKDAVHIQN